MKADNAIHAKRFGPLPVAVLRQTVSDVKIAFAECCLVALDDTRHSRTLALHDNQSRRMLPATLPTLVNSNSMGYEEPS